MSKLVLVGEAWGEYEERERAPFRGPTGHELRRMCEEAGIHLADCLLTNVFNLRPPSNKIEAFCGAKNYGLPNFPALVKGKYVNAKYESELLRLREEIESINPNLIIALGNTACWALLGKTAITKLRGTTQLSTYTIGGYKVLPTYHPAAIFRQWELRPVAIIDLIKAKREAEFPEIRRPKREIWIEPNLEDIYEFHDRYVAHASRLAIDIETTGSRITCVGIAPSASLAIVIPFEDKRNRSKCYWPSTESELKAWKYIKSVCEGNWKKIFQNGLYDIAFFYRAYGIKVRNAEEDTMLLHHALQPESLKGLGFLGSIYTDEGSWKHMRTTATIKKDE